MSPGTAKTSVEGLAQGGKVRKDGRIVSVPPAYKTRRIDFGDGEKLAVTNPWGTSRQPTQRQAFPTSRSTFRAHRQSSHGYGAPTGSGG